ncbi:bacterial Ig-like domain-containing protein, partial [Enterococcus gallinarum]|uniref:bacterial Ig-like domain-containing protein n=1 Tax=Enterococcus gallinarum TaxID=1353 RepID=UPI00336AB6C6
MATITVVSDQATVVAIDSTLYVGDTWQGEDNFVSETDKEGKTLSVAELDIPGDVDTTTPGKYEI